MFAKLAKLPDTDPPRAAAAADGAAPDEAPAAMEAEDAPTAAEQHKAETAAGLSGLQDTAAEQNGHAQPAAAAPAPMAVDA